MDTLARCLQTVVVALVPMTTALAQVSEAPIDFKPATQQVEQLLRSPLPKDQAWGAYLVGELNLHDLLPELIEFIESGRSFGFEGDREYALRAAVDSLIRIGATPPPGLLDQYGELIRTEAILLFQRDPDQHGTTVVAWLHQEGDFAHRRALAALALRANAPGFAAWVLEDVQISATLRIVNAGIGGGGGGAVSTCTGGCRRRMPVPEGFPLFGVYQLSPQPWLGSRVLIHGSQPIYYDRVLATHDSTRLDCTGNAPMTVNERFDYIAALTQTSRRTLPLKSSYSGSVVLVGESDLANARHKLRNKIEQDFHSVVETLIATGALASVEASNLSPKISLTVIDQR